MKYLSDVKFEATAAFAADRDTTDPLRSSREKFFIPKNPDGSEVIYFTGNSLGLQPKTAKSYIEQELEDWKNLGVEGHLHAKNPWLPYHEFLTEQMARVVGAKPIETVVMNSLTVNLHLLMVSFYRPTAERYKIIIEKGAFPSDRYAVESQIKFHSSVLNNDFSRPSTAAGVVSPHESKGSTQPIETSESNAQPESPPDGGIQNALIELAPREGETILRTEDILETIEREGDSIALILLGGVNYYTGQAFDMRAITEAGHRAGAVVGFDLAHAAGNLELQLHDWDIDFAAWCSYKYLNAGPGSIAGVFVHERHAHSFDLPRFAGWWGHDKSTRFLMEPDFKPMPGAEGWQISNPPIFQMAALRASLEIFDEFGIAALRRKSVELTGYLEFLLRSIRDDRISIITPSDQDQRGCQLSIRVQDADKSLFDVITTRSVIADWREPDVIRVAPVPLYNSFEDVFRFASILRSCLS